MGIMEDMEADLCLSSRNSNSHFLIPAILNKIRIMWSYDAVLHAFCGRQNVREDFLHKINAEKPGITLLLMLDVII